MPIKVDTHLYSTHQDMPHAQCEDIVGSVELVSLQLRIYAKHCITIAMNSICFFVVYYGVFE